MSTSEAQSKEQRWFRVTCVLPFAALEIHDDSPPPVLSAQTSTLYSDRARTAIARVSRRDIEIRESFYALYDGLIHLERELEELRRNLRLAAAGIELKPELVHLGGDGITLQRPTPWRVGDSLYIYVALILRNSEHLIGIPVTVGAGAEGCTDLTFGPMTPEQRDRIVAFTFQQQGRERRRARDAADNLC